MWLRIDQYSKKLHRCYPIYNQFLSKNTFIIKYRSSWDKENECFRLVILVESQ